MRRLAYMSHAARDRNRMVSGPPEPDPRQFRLDQGELICSIRVQDRTGLVRQMVIRQGERKNQVRVDGMREDHGWDYITRRLRTKLSSIT